MSGDQDTDPTSLLFAHPAIGDSLQLPLDGPCTGKHAPVHVIEPIIRCVKDEAAGDPGGNSNRAAIELDCKSLRNHGDSAPDAQQ